MTQLGLARWVGNHVPVYAYANKPETKMKRSLAPTVALAAMVAMSAAHAGGPVIIQEEGQPEVIAEKPASSVGLLPLLLIPIVLCLALCGGDDDGDPGETATGTK